jgi:molybdate transport system regulatory protein
VQRLVDSGARILTARKGRHGQRGGLARMSSRRFQGRVKPKIKLWVAFGDDLKFGDGRARLLERIGERGSLQKAAEEFEMSYRNAWGYLGELERAAGFKFLERTAGGGPQSGMRLTEEAKRFLSRYWKFREAIERAVKLEFDRTFRR